MAGLKKSPRTRWVLMSFDMSEDCATEDERTRGQTQTQRIATIEKCSLSWD
ncbi:hypothetical protein FOMA001_g11192 [Fusarium oxysporum f. sp. matthiolae]|nr:hypothetical protein FOMA001_g11192 [Fusarium oxysporum f. sp. matthiolae]